MLRCFAPAAVGAPLRCLPLRANLPAFRRRIDFAVEQMIPHLLFEMALRGLIAPEHALSWEHGAAALTSVTIGGELLAPEGATGLRFSANQVIALRHGAEIARISLDREGLQRARTTDLRAFRFAQRYRRVGKITHFATTDQNPIAEFEAHPDKAGNHIDLGGRSEDEWIDVLDESFELIERFMPGELAEMELMLREIIPVGYDPVRHLSASYREVVGTIYLTLHPNVMTMTEAVIHEFQHNKLNVSSFSADYLTNAFHPLYPSPVRPDPRPLWGILLAVHAFLPVAELYRRMRDGGHPLAALPEFDRRMSEIDMKNHEGMEMLRAHAQFTAAGRAMIDDLEALERRHLAERKARGLDTMPTDVHLA
jgi:HEXXH motif-containing protein